MHKTKEQNNYGNLEIISVDHGNKQIKGEYGLKFDSGFFESSMEPINTDNLLKYSKYYSVGRNRFEVMDNKTLDDKFFILTLPVIGNTLLKRGIKKTDICIAGGLPIVNYGRLKDNFRNYFIRDGITFQFKGEKFEVNIKEALIFTQCMAGIMPEFHDYKDMSTIILVDLGGRTLDYTIMEKGIPNIQRTGSQNMGVIQLFNTIKQEVLSYSGTMINENQIEEIILNNYNPLFLDESIIKIVNQKTEEFINSILWKLREENFETKANPVIFMGGGAKLLERYLKNNDKLAYYEVLDEFANLEGFKLLARQKLANIRK